MTLLGYIRYLVYVVRHRWFVMLACSTRGLYWRGLTHDLSKFLPSEFFPYAQHFHGPKAKRWRDKTGYYKPANTGDPAFDYAWFLHQKRNDHHWQFWCFPSDPETLTVLRMSDAARLEMICDWVGAAKAQGAAGVPEWWKANQHKLRLHPETRDAVCADIIRMRGLACSSVDSV